MIKDQPLGQRPNVLGAVQSEEICKRVKLKTDIEKIR